MIIYKGPKGRRSLEKGSKHNIQLRNVFIEHRDVRGSGGGMTAEFKMVKEKTRQGSAVEEILE